MRFPSGVLSFLHDVGQKIAAVSTELGTNPKVSLPFTGFLVVVYEWTTEEMLKALTLVFISFQIIVILPKVPAALVDIYAGIKKGIKGIGRAIRYICTFFL